MEPLFSIITVCRNSAEALDTSIHSLMKQGFKNFEYIIVDGASTDQKTHNVINKYTDQISVFVSEPDNGIYDAMNKGIKLARGFYLYFLNAGDSFYDEDVLVDVATIIQSKDYPEIIFGNVELTNASGGRSVQSRINCEVIDLFYKPINHQTIFTKRKSALHGFNTQFKILADYDLFLFLITLPETKIAFIDRIISHYNMEGFSNKNKGMLQHELKLIRKKYFKSVFIWTLIFIKGTRLMHLLKINQIRRVINKSLLKSEVKRHTITNV